jgi:hypothetical protein
MLYVPRHTACDSLVANPLLYATNNRLLALLQLRNMNATQVAVTGDPTKDVRVLGHFPGSLAHAFLGVSGYLYRVPEADFVCGAKLRAYRFKPYEFVRTNPAPLSPASFERVDNLYTELLRMPGIEFYEAEHSVERDKEESDRVAQTIEQLEKIYAGLIPSRPLQIPASKLFK